MGAPARAQAKPSTDGPRDAAQHRRGRHDQLHPVAELDGSGNLVSRFVWASKKNTPDLVITAGITYRVLTDQLGSPRALVDTTSGTIAGVMRHDAWGVVLEDSLSSLMPFGFAGGLYDAETGLVRFGARDYDASVGRWITKDPLRFGGRQANIYVYVKNDPINLQDPQGEDTGSQLRCMANFLSYCGTACFTAETNPISAGACVACLPLVAFGGPCDDVEKPDPYEPPPPPRCDPSSECCDEATGAPAGPAPGSGGNGGF